MILNLDNQNVKAILFMIGSGLLIAITAIFAKILGTDTSANTGLNPFQISAGRFIFAFICIVLFISIKRPVGLITKNTKWKLHFLRSICGWLGISSMFTALAKMPVSEAIAISFLSPIVATALAVLVLKEQLSIQKITASCIALIGASLILKPGTEAFQISGLWALGAAAFMGIEAIFIKRLSDTEPATRVLFLNNGIGALLSLIFASLIWTWPNQTQWLLLMALGSVMVIGQTLFIQSMKRGNASLVMPSYYSVLIFAVIFDLLIFQVLPDWLAGTGILLIIVSALILAIKKI